MGRTNASQVHVADPAAPCPCGSNEAGIDCCLDSTGRIRGIVKPVRITPPQGSHQNPRCYAAPLGGCSAKISAEHYVSDGLLRDILDVMKGRRPGTPVFEVRHAKWLPEGETSRVVGRRIEAKVLCQAHNEALSPLDRIGKRFGAAVVRAALARPGDEPEGETILLNGEDFERWLLKILCGVKAMESRVDKTDWSPPLVWLRALFKIDGEAMPGGFGFWLDLKAHELLPAGSLFSTTPIDSRTSGPNPLGLRFHLCGIEHVLMIGDEGRSRVIRNGRLRPGLIDYEFDGATVRVGFTYKYSPRGLYLRGIMLAPRP